MTEIIDLWLKLSPIDRQNIADQINALLESSNIEKSFDVSIDNQVANDKTVHKIICGDINKILIDKVDLIFTSPPYNANIEYDVYKDNLSVKDYLDFLKNSIISCDKFLCSGGRFVINIRDISHGKGKRIPIIHSLYNWFQDLNYSYRGLHLWYKGREESSFGWGSYLSSNNPSIIDLYEYVLVFQKDGEHKNGQDNMNKMEFIENVMGVWKIRPVKKIFGSNKQNIANHPCPFPIELAKRVIKLYSHVGDWVLDPFAGIMSTALASAQSGRNSISVDLSEKYCQDGRNRLTKEFMDLSYNCEIQ